MITCSQLGVSKWGRLGNQLFQIAATLGIAHRNGQAAIFPAWSYSHCFAHPLPQGHLPDAQVYKHDSQFYQPIDLPAGNWDLQGFFPSEKFFDAIAPDIRRQFEPSADVLAYIDQKYGRLLAKCPCSIHVRRGDYLQLNWDFPTQSLAYYQHAIQQFPTDTLFLIFSDDIAWCRQHFVGSQFEFVEKEEDIIDLLLMSRCSNHIIANSTFSWWGAWLNPNSDKVVLCPARWYGPGVSARPQHYTRDLYAHGFQPLLLPGERQWRINLYYALSHPFYAAWSKTYTFLLRIYGLESVRNIVKKFKS
ncbi:alpha-1,2-fucosyltransferase [Spirosoma harenae]